MVMFISEMVRKTLTWVLCYKLNCLYNNVSFFLFNHLKAKPINKKRGEMDYYTVLSLEVTPPEESKSVGRSSCRVYWCC